MTYGSNQFDLSRLLNPQVVKLKAEADDWREAVRIAGNLLVENGLVEKVYVQAMIDLVEELGHYIVIMPGLALPHARASDGVLKNGLSLVTLKEPVFFNHPQNDPVHVLIAFCAQGNDTHLEVLARLARILGQVDFLSRAIAAQSLSEVQKLFKTSQGAREERS